MAGHPAGIAAAPTQEKQDFTSRQLRGFSAASLAAIPLAMGVTVFDRSVIQFANGSAKSLQEAVFKGWKGVLTRPVHTFNSLDNRAVMAVYVPTYITKNVVEASCDYRGINPFYPVFFITAAINTTLGIMKDRYLAQMFGSGVPNFPKMSYALFAASFSAAWFRFKPGGLAGFSHHLRNTFVLYFFCGLVFESCCHIIASLLLKS